MAIAEQQIRKGLTKQRSKNPKLKIIYYYGGF